MRRRFQTVIPTATMVRYNDVETLDIDIIFYSAYITCHEGKLQPDQDPTEVPLSP